MWKLVLLVLSTFAMTAIADSETSQVTEYVPSVHAAQYLPDQALLAHENSL